MAAENVLLGSNKLYGGRNLDIKNLDVSIVTGNKNSNNVQITDRVLVNGFGSNLLHTGGLELYYDSVNDLSAIASLQRDTVQWHHIDLYGQTIELKTHPTSGNPALGLIVDSSGNVGIKQAVPTADLELLADDAKKPATDVWTIVSDERIKENIENADLKQCYNDIKALQLRRFRWRDDAYDDENIRGDRHQLGFIAQEVELINPKSVETVPGETVFKTKRVDENGELVKDEDGNQLYNDFTIENLKQLNNAQLVKSLFGAVQKLIEKVETLENA